MNPGERGKVIRVEGSGDLRQRIMDMGIIKGTEIKVIRKAPLGDPVEFLLKGYNLALRRSEAENVIVEIENAQE
ncbi:MAG: FeoA family protein [Candidatus Syntropharchaeia archaeon]